MYNTKYECLYNSQDIFTKEDQITNEDREFILDVLYRNDLLYIFDMSEFNEESLNTGIHELYEKVKHHPELKSCMNKLADRFMNTDEELGLMVMFSFDYLYLTHPCICEFLEKGEISENNIRAIKNIIF